MCSMKRKLINHTKSLSRYFTETSGLALCASLWLQHFARGKIKVVLSLTLKSFVADAARYRILLYLLIYFSAIYNIQCTHVHTVDRITRVIVFRFEWLTTILYIVRAILSFHFLLGVIFLPRCIMQVSQKWKRHIFDLAVREKKAHGIFAMEFFFLTADSTEVRRVNGRQSTFITAESNSSEVIHDIFSLDKDARLRI